jgi:ATP-dependent exoDNAse (exonuclease V) alpha subunit
MEAKLSKFQQMPIHIDYAYATTVNSSQGLTSDRCLIDIQTKSLTTAKDLYYVAISRAKIEACIYTNGARELPKAISREKIKASALDVVKADRDRACVESITRITRTTQLKTHERVLVKT